SRKKVASGKFFSLRVDFHYSQNAMLYNDMHKNGMMWASYPTKQSIFGLVVFFIAMKKSNKTADNLFDWFFCKKINVRVFIPQHLL
ncbi:MAG: hypothetical protein RSB11_06715, partial [Oscillospiraceae bacterium]